MSLNGEGCSVKEKKATSEEMRNCLSNAKEKSGELPLD